VRKKKKKTPPWVGEEAGGAFSFMGRNVT